MIRHAQSASNAKSEELAKLAEGREDDAEFREMAHKQVHCNPKLIDAPLT